ncbi:MAG: hypothetical protein VKL39_20525 [Leptolyngbyaceae bacterium]|nr:hypothetical protein [Leptolyngbyaceae bacterium]
MADLRGIQAKLAATVTDTVLGKLGYREFTVFAPDGTQITPDPEVRFLEGASLDRLVNYLQAQGLDYPSSAVRVKVNRHNTPLESTLENGRWVLLDKASGEETEWNLARHTQTDDRYLVDLVLHHGPL